MIDARAMVRRHAAELLLLAVGAGAIALAVWGGVAHAQAIDPVAADYPVDFNAIIWGGGGAGAVGGLGLVGWMISQRYAPLRRRREEPPTAVEESSSAIRGAPLSVELERRLDRVEAEQTRNREAMVRLEANQTRALLEVKELRDLAQQILLRFMERGGSRG